MQKTTVYLPDELKAELERTAEETGKSEAELIREGVKHVVKQRRPPAPRGAIFHSGIPDLGSRVDEFLAKGFGRD